MTICMKKDGKKCILANRPGIIHVASVYTKYTSDRDRTLAGQDQCQAQDGYQWVRSSEPLPKE